MKEYLHTIFRSLCVVTLLCGSMNVWADDSTSWSDVFSTDEGNGTSENRYVITQDNWDDFIAGLDAELSVNDVYFQLGGNVVLTSAPSSSITSDITDSNFSFGTDNEDNYYSISVNVESIDDVFFDTSRNPVFEDETLESSVHNLYTLTLSNWDNFVTNAINAETNDYFILNADITITSSEELPCLDISKDNFSFGTNSETNEPYTISVGSNTSSDELFPCPDFTESYVFCDYELEEKVNYYLSISSEDDVYSLASSCINEYISDNAHVYLIKDVTLSAIPDDCPISKDIITPGNFITSDIDNPSTTYTINVGSDDSNDDLAAIPESSSSFPYIFENNTLQGNVSYYYSIDSSDDLGIIATWYADTENPVVGNVNMYLTADVDVESVSAQIPSSLTSSNFYFKGPDESDNHTISITEEFAKDGSNTKLFADTDLDADVTYNYTISGSNWENFATNSENATSNEYFSLSSDIEFSGADSYPTSISENIDTDHFKFGDYKIKVGTYDYPFELDDAVPLFANKDLESEGDSYISYNYKLTCADDVSTLNEKRETLNKSNVDLYFRSGDSSTVIDLSTVDMSIDGTENWNIYSTGNLKFCLQESYYGRENELFKVQDATFSYIYTPSKLLLDSFYQGAVSETDKQGANYDFDKIKDLAGHGTSSAPYLIATYDMLKVLVDYVNDKYTADGTNLTEGMYIKLISDINAQGGERLTDISGNEIIDSPVENIQFSVPFKGHFDGNKFSLGGFTQPLFSSLDGATIVNLGIVDCYMTTTPALANSASNGATVSMSYVSGVSDGLIPSSGITATNCYAFNPANYDAETTGSGYTSYNLTATTTADASGTHNILSDNCYDNKFDCTLFIPTDNTFYNYVNSNEDYKKLVNFYDGIEYPDINGIDISSATGKRVLGNTFINWSNFSSLDYECVDNPAKSNLCLLHNVVQTNGCWLLEGNTYFKEGGREYGDDAAFYAFDDLYSWYLVDKSTYALGNIGDFRIKNIYYSRGVGAYDGLNTVYLPFAWDYANDVVDKDGKSVGATAYVLADKTSGTGENEKFDNDGSVKDYSSATSLLFFTPGNTDFNSVSCGLPTILSVPTGKTGWAIKKKADSWFYYTKHDIEDYGDDGRPNLRNRYDGDKFYSLEDSKWGNGRSFMDFTRLKGDNSILFESGHAYHCGAFELLKKTTFGSGTLSGIQGKTLSAYKLNSKGTDYVSVTENSTVQPFRTFIAIAPGSSSAKQSFGFGITGISDTEDTAIDGVHVDNIELLTPKQSRVYSIDGRYVGQYGKKFAPGMYIMNGKKFVVK